MLINCFPGNYAQVITTLIFCMWISCTKTSNKIHIQWHKGIKKQNNVFQSKQIYLNVKCRLWATGISGKWWVEMRAYPVLNHLWSRAQMAIFRTRIKGPAEGLCVQQTICRSIKKKRQKEVWGGLIYIPLTLQDPWRTGQDISSHKWFS